MTEEQITEEEIIRRGLDQTTPTRIFRRVTHFCLRNGLCASDLTEMVEAERLIEGAENPEEPYIVAAGEKFVIARGIGEKTHFLLDNGVTERRWTLLFRESSLYHSLESAQKAYAEMPEGTQ